MSNIGKSEIRNIIALLYVSLVVVFIYVLVFHTVPATNKDLVNVLGGVVVGGVNMILSYFFGSSKNESDKNKDDV